MENFIGLEVHLETEKTTKGINVTEEKTFSKFINLSKESIEKLINLSTNRLPLKFIITVSLIDHNYNSHSLVRIVSQFNKIELRKAIGSMFEIQDEYERKGHWKHKMKKFIYKELDEFVDLQNRIKRG